MSTDQRTIPDIPGIVWVGGKPYSIERQAWFLLEFRETDDGLEPICYHCDRLTGKINLGELIELCAIYQSDMPLLHEHCERDFLDVSEATPLKKPPSTNRGVTFYGGETK